MGSDKEFFASDPIRNDDSGFENRKDLRIAFEEAERCGAELPVTQIVDAYYSEIEARGGGRWDTSSLITRLGTSGKA